MSKDDMIPVAKQCVEELRVLFATNPGKAWEFDIGDYMKWTDKRAWVSAEDDGSISISLRYPPGSRSSSEHWTVTIDGVDGHLIAYDAREKRTPWGRPGLPEMIPTKDLREGQDTYEFVIQDVLKVLTTNQKDCYWPED